MTWGIDEAYNFASHLCVDKSLAGRAVWHSDGFGLAVWICGEEHVLVVSTADILDKDDGDATNPSSTPFNTSVPLPSTIVDAVSMTLAAHGTAQSTLEQISSQLPFETNEELG